MHVFQGAWKRREVDWPDAPEQVRLLIEARKSAAHARLSLQRQNWQGAIGNWSGAGIGSSIDFQDHRPYLPGDDPRYIDWAAYARSGHYIMKLYREEVSPKVDVILDVSRSMIWNEEKRTRVLELLFFCVESGLGSGATVKVYGIVGNQWRHHGVEVLLAGRLVPPEFTTDGLPPDVTSLPLQSGSLRILISDLLYDVSPHSLLRALSAARGRVSMLTPYSADEENPSWRGNVELLDCEIGRGRRQRVDADILKRYVSAYRGHFASWRDAARRYDARMARVPAHGSLSDALRGEAITSGVVEAWT